MILKNGKRLDGMGDSMPIGSVIEYNGTDIPDGWEILPGDANVYIGSDLPTDKQEVWIKKGKNLVPNDILLWETGHYAMENGNKSSYKGRIRLAQLIPVRPNTTYYCNVFKEDYSFVIRGYDKNKQFTYSIGGMTNTETFTTNSSTCYIGVSIYGLTNEDTTYDDYVELMASQTIKPLICLNSCTNKEYEEYIPKEIRLKDINGEIYETFYSENLYDKHYVSDSERVVGTWLNGQPLYQKTIACGALPNAAEKSVDHGIANIDVVTRVYGIAINESEPRNSFPLPFASTILDASMFVYGNKTKIVLGTGRDRTGFTQSYVTIEYTKTIN